MRLGETTASARRIGPLAAFTITGDPVLGEDFTGLGELEISVGDGGFATATGGVVEIGDGYYYYQATAGDASVAPWVTIKITGVCQEFTIREDVDARPDGIAVGETDEDLLAIGPLWAIEEDETPIVDPSSITTEISINGSAWAPAAGILESLSPGYVEYQADTTEVTSVGWLAIKISGTAQEFVSREDIISVDIDDPVITAISPTPGVEPGDPGGFPNGRVAALQVPIVITVVSSDLQYVNITLRTYQDGDTNGHIEESVYRNGEFREPFRNESTLSGSTYTIIRDGGWTGVFLVLSVDAMDMFGNFVTAEFTYQLPETFTATVTEVEEGEVDHTAAALNRIAWQFRSESHVG